MKTIGKLFVKGSVRTFMDDATVLQKAGLNLLLLQVTSAELAAVARLIPYELSPALQLAFPVSAAVASCDEGRRERGHDLTSQPNAHLGARLPPSSRSSRLFSYPTLELQL